MSSSMRWRNGLMGFSLIGGSCLEVGVLQPLDPQDGAPARHQRSINALAVLLTVSIPATFSRGSGFVPWHIADCRLTAKNIAEQCSARGPQVALLAKCGDDLA